LHDINVHTTTVPTFHPNFQQASQQTNNSLRFQALIPGLLADVGRPAHILVAAVCAAANQTDLWTRMTVLRSGQGRWRRYPGVNTFITGRVGGWLTYIFLY